MGSDVHIDPLLGRVLAGKLEILQLLGTGAMGKVYRAHHIALDKAVAIKVLLRLEGAQKQHALRFKAEARAASRLDHPNSVQILDFGEDEKDGLLYIAMELLEGQDLQSVLAREKRLETQRVCWIMAQTLSALGAAHAKGVVHRDMKPGNIMLVKKTSEDGAIADFVKVCDFGLAKIVDVAGSDDGSSGPLTKQGAIFGTPAYMSPEQARGETLDPRTDIYSCGVIIYKSIVGQTPFQAESATGVLMKHICEEPPSIAKQVPNVDPRLEAVVMRAMAKDKGRRFQEAREMRNALREILRDYGVEVPSMTSPQLAIGGLFGPPSQSPRDSGEGPLPGSAPPGTMPDRPRTPSFVRTQRMPSGTDPRGAESTMAATVRSARPASASLAPPAPALADDLATAVPRTIPAANDVRTLQTLSPEASAPGTVPQQPRMNPLWVAAIPGSLALIAVGGLCVYVVLGMNRAQQQPPPPIEQQPPPVAIVAPVQTPPPPPPVERAPIEAVATTPPVEVDKPAAKRKAIARREDPVKPPVEVAVQTPPPPIEEPKPPPVIVEKPVEKQPEPPPPPPPPPVETGPKKLGAGFRLASKLTCTRIDGGASKNRAQESIQRFKDGVDTCVKGVLRAKGVEASGSVTIEGRLGMAGELRNVSASGLGGAEKCVQDVFMSVRGLPKPDTGEAKIVFVLEYKTEG